MKRLIKKVYIFLIILIYIILLKLRGIKSYFKIKQVPFSIKLHIIYCLKIGSDTMSKCENTHDLEDFCDDSCNNSFNNCSDPWSDPWCEPWFDPSCDSSIEDCCE